jgi:hypothetical protein
MNFTVTDSAALIPSVNCSMTFDGGVRSYENFNVTTAAVYTGLASQSGLAQGRHTWNVSCWNGTLEEHVESGIWNFVQDTVGPVYSAPTVVMNVNPSTGVGNYTITVTITDATNAVSASSPPRLWYGYSGTADTARTLASSGAGVYTTTVTIPLGNTLTYDFTATDTIGTATTSTGYSIRTSTGTCETLQALIFAGLALVALGAIAVAAFLIAQGAGGSLDSTTLGAGVTAIMVLGLVVVVGYYIISQVALTACTVAV